MSRSVEHYSLDVTYLGWLPREVASTAHSFATQRLREYIVKVIPQAHERVKGAGGGNYLELLAPPATRCHRRRAAR